MPRLAIAFSLSLLWLSSSALANSGASDDNVLLINVTSVEIPADLPGACEVRGTVEEVLSGTAFQQSRPLMIKVPCGSQLHVRPLLPAEKTRGPQMISPDVLSKSKMGVAHLDNFGNLLWKPTKGFYLGMGAIFGYRVVVTGGLLITPSKR